MSIVNKQKQTSKAIATLGDTPDPQAGVHSWKWS